MDRKKKIVIISSVVFLLALLGVTYAWFQFYQTGSNNKLIAGDIYLDLTNGTDQINLTNVFPETETEARDSLKHVEGETSDNTFTFTIAGKNDTSNTLYYEIQLVHGDDESGKIRFNDEDLRFDLFEMNNGQEVTPYIISAGSYATLNNRQIHFGTVAAGQTVDKTYRIRMWLSSDVLVSDTDPLADYKETGTYALKNHYASIKIAVLGDFNTRQSQNSLYTKIQTLASESYIGTYTGSHNDTLAGIGSSPIYYYTGSSAAANSNVLFAGFCWQIVRTTDDGGVKLLFNGQSDANNECGANRTPIVGVNGYTGVQSTDLSTQYTYGKSFTYNETTNQFELQDVTSKTWGNSTYEDLIGTYTCKNANPCTTVYYIGSYQDATHASTESYTVGSATNYQTIGMSAFNAFYDSPSLVGYMYNTVYTAKSGLKTGNHLYGNNVTYTGGNYTVGATQASIDNTHHYTCDSDVENQITCAKVRYYYREQSGTYYYIVLENGKNINDAIKEMINYKENNSDTDANINKYNSAIKGILENWYRHSLTGFTNYLDQDTIYCNERRVRELNGWTENGNLANYLQFQQNTATTDLSCVNHSDSFSVKNNNAKLEYAIGLLTEPERGLMGTSYAGIGNNTWWWLVSPIAFYTGEAYVRYVTDAGAYDGTNVYYGGAVRPAITLKPNTIVTSGTGATDTPYVIG